MTPHAACEDTMFSIAHVTGQDVGFWMSIDRHISEPELRLKIRDRRGYVIRDGGTPVGVLRYGLFWDSIPFLNMICFVEEYRGRGFGSLAMAHWENEMRSLGCKIAMTSTMAEENSQRFYRKLGYKDCGCLVKDIPPLVETMEIFLMKRL